MPRKKHLINVHTSTGTTAPADASLYLGEIAVQHTPNEPALWIKVGTDNTSTTYEKFIGQTEIINLIDNTEVILGSGYTYSGIPYVNSATTIAAAYSAATSILLNLSGTLEDDEYAIAEALNDVNNRILELSGDTVDLGPLSASVVSVSQGLNTLSGATAGLSGVVASLSAAIPDDSNLVHKTGNEYIVGKKYFQSGATVYKELHVDGVGSYLQNDQERGFGWIMDTDGVTLDDRLDSLYDDGLYISASTTGLSGAVVAISAAMADISVDMILGSGYTYSGISYVNSATSIADAYSALTNEFIKTEKTAAEAVNDLNTRLVALSGIVEDLSGGTGSAAPLSAAVVSLSAATTGISQGLNTLSGVVMTISGGGGGADVGPLSAAVISLSAATPIDSNLVHISGDETISGIKTFDEEVHFDGDETYFYNPVYVHGTHVVFEANQGEPIPTLTNGARSGFNWILDENDVSVQDYINSASTGVTALSAATTGISTNLNNLSAATTGISHDLAELSAATTGMGVTISTDVVADRTGNTKAAGTKAVYDEIHPATGSTMPNGGFLPNVFYALGTITGSVTFTLAAPVDSSVMNHYYWTFDTGSSAPTITWPSVTWFDNNGPNVQANKHYEISILNGIGVYMEVELQV